MIDMLKTIFVMAMAFLAPVLWIKQYGDVYLSYPEPSPASSIICPVDTATDADQLDTSLVMWRE